MSANVQTSTANLAADKSSVDVHRKYVRVLPQQGSRADIVRFEFAIGWPDLSVELALPKASFEEFCALHSVEMLPEAEPDALHQFDVS